MEPTFIFTPNMELPIDISMQLDEDEELAGYGIRKTYYKNYKIYFLIDERERTVYILRVFHMLVDSKEKILRIFRA